VPCTWSRARPPDRRDRARYPGSSSESYDTRDRLGALRPQPDQPEVCRSQRSTGARARTGGSATRTGAATSARSSRCRSARPLRGVGVRHSVADTRALVPSRQTPEPVSRRVRRLTLHLRRLDSSSGLITVRCRTPTLVGAERFEQRVDLACGSTGPGRRSHRSGPRAGAALRPSSPPADRVEVVALHSRSRVS